MQLVFIENGQAVTDSLTVAEVFGKRHDHVMRDIVVQLTKLREAGEEEWGTLNFGETQYQHPQNGQWYFKYNMTEDGFAILAMSYVTPEAMKAKVRFLNEFRRLKDELQKPMTPLEMIAQLAAQAVEKEKADARRDQEIRALQAGVTTIRDTIIQRDDDWRNAINKMFNKAVLNSSDQDFQALRSESYKILEERARCDLNTRLRNMKERLAREGAPKSKIDKVSRVDVIEADPRLKEIYTSIVKELSVRFMPIAR